MKQLTITNIPKLPFAVEESINQLRVNLEFCGENIRVIMVTSSVPNEGKSFVALNLWRTLAELGKQVLLIDCDLRKSVLSGKYGMHSDEPLTGVVHYLAGKTTLEESMYETNIPDGYIMPVSRTVTNPKLLLENDLFPVMMKTCREWFDYVIVDTPPLDSVADAMNVAKYVDGTMLVVHSGKTSKKLVQNSVQSLKRTNKPLLGVVLNRVGMTERSAYYRNKKYYGYYGRYGHYGYEDK